MDSFWYGQGQVKGLSPLAYRGRSSGFYSKRHRENTRENISDSKVEEKYKYLTPSRWRKTGWKYGKLPEIQVKPESFKTPELLTTYNSFFTSYSAAERKIAKKPADTLGTPVHNWKLQRLKNLKKTT